MLPEMTPNMTKMAPKSIKNTIKIDPGVPPEHVPNTRSQKDPPPRESLLQLALKMPPQIAILGDVGVTFSLFFHIRSLNDFLIAFSMISGFVLSPF